MAYEEKCVSETHLEWRLRSARGSDAPRLTELLAQLGYSNELDAVTNRLERILNSVDQQILVALRSEDSCIDGYISVERRLMLHVGGHLEITGLVVDSAARRSGVGKALVDAAEQWALKHGLCVIVVRSNVVRQESHPFYEKNGYGRTGTSHVYRKELHVGGACPPLS